MSLTVIFSHALFTLIKFHLHRDALPRLCRKRSGGAAPGASCSPLTTSYRPHVAPYPACAYTVSEAEYRRRVSS